MPDTSSKYDTYRELLGDIAWFDQKCRRDEYTDTVKGHEILEKARRKLEDYEETSALRDRITVFQEKCTRDEYTDSVELWESLNDCRNWLLPRTGRMAQQK